jgi:hypothetical protein
MGRQVEQPAQDIVCLVGFRRFVIVYDEQVVALLLVQLGEHIRKTLYSRFLCFYLQAQGIIQILSKKGVYQMYALPYVEDMRVVVLVVVGVLLHEGSLAYSAHAIHENSPLACL